MIVSGRSTDTIQSGGNFNVRTNSFLTTVVGPDGVALIEALNNNADIALNEGSTWDVMLAGGVMLSAVSSNDVFRATDAVFTGLTTFNETLWTRSLRGATGNSEPRIESLELAGSSLGVLLGW